MPSAWRSRSRTALAWCRSAAGRGARILRTALVKLCWSVGILGLLMIVLAFTRVPYDLHRWLGTAAGECERVPEAIVVLGGSGMPSGPELLRLHHAAHLAGQWPQAQVIVVHPGDTAVIGQMVDELVLKGVSPERIVQVREGDNTRAQALACLRHCSTAKPSMALVTAPENMYRSVRAFRKAGFSRGVCGAPAWDHAMYHAFDYEHRGIGGKAWVPDVSDEPALRYTFWNYLKLEVTCLREYVAIAYYRLNGWI
jgi:uncharacterized SAM-binding protein YcdF (DUF218 family)